MDWMDKQLDGLVSQIITPSFVAIITPNINGCVQNFNLIYLK